MNLDRDRDPDLDLSPSLLPAPQNEQTTDPASPRGYGRTGYTDGHGYKKYIATAQVSYNNSPHGCFFDNLNETVGGALRPDLPSDLTAIGG